MHSEAEEEEEEEGSGGRFPVEDPYSQSSAQCKSMRKDRAHLPLRSPPLYCALLVRHLPPQRPSFPGIS